MCVCVCVLISLALKKYIYIQIESKLTNVPNPVLQVKAFYNTITPLLPFTLQCGHTWFWFIEWIAHGHAGVAWPHKGSQPAEDILSGMRAVAILQLITLGPLSFVFLPFVGDRS